LNEGSRARIYIPSPLAYGAQGVPQIGIGPNANLVFEVEVRRIAPKTNETKILPAHRTLIFSR
jgi:FKBP-type peptidyl-prolyl cis-trans isomerase FkpA